MKQRRVYLDHAATTPVATEVLEAMMPYFSEKYGNASSVHSYGREAKMALEESRATVARKLNAEPDEIVFTSGGTESNNLALKGVMLLNKERCRHLITTRLEHNSVLNPCRWLEHQGCEVTYLDVDEYGVVDPHEVERAIKRDTHLISIGHANNEIGTVQNLEEIGRIAKKERILFHTDACQSFTKEPLDVERFGLDLVTVNSHKIRGPKGVGALYVRKGVKVSPIIRGGGHEHSLRAGTENVSGIVGFAKAADAMKTKDVEYMRSLRDRLIKAVLKDVPKTRLNGHPENRLCNNANFTFKGIEGEALLLRLDVRGIAASTGSACSSHSLQPSHVLLAIGLRPEEAHGSLRLTLGPENSKDDVDYVVSAIKDEAAALRAISPSWRK
jgi:cysteine desulfurase